MKDETREKVSELLEKYREAFSKRETVKSDAAKWRLKVELENLVASNILEDYKIYFPEKAIVYRKYDKLLWSEPVYLKTGKS